MAGPPYSLLEWEVNQMQQPMQGGDAGRILLCSARDCSYNQNTKCIAEAVHVNLHEDHADCETYTENRHPPMQMGQTGKTGQ